MTESTGQRRRVVVIGGGFGGLAFCQGLRGEFAVTLVDRQNHHVFQPLLYQVATAGLGATDIAQPLRSILRGRGVECVMGEVVDIDVKGRAVTLGGGEILKYDWLVFAAGGRTSYFGHDEWAGSSLGLKTLADALAIRRRVLTSFERAEVTGDEAERKRLMTCVVIGGGPTGVELAGALVELARVVFRGDFRRIDTSSAKVILVERGDGLLDAFPRELRESAARQLEGLGVEVRFNSPVTKVEDGKVEAGGKVIESANIFWTAGVEAVGLTRKLGAEVDKAGRVKVERDLSLPGHPEVFVVGDAAVVVGRDGKAVPGVAPAAIQMGRFVAGVISDPRVREKAAGERPTFEYRDKGMMATIGRKAAVAVIGKVRLSGLVAWCGWLFVHLLWLIGLRNKIIVLTQWAWAYFRYQRGARIITGAENVQGPKSKVQS